MRQHVTRATFNVKVVHRFETDLPPFLRCLGVKVVFLMRFLTEI